jgi:steroid 5-alpha reductase family enzyme
MLFTLPRASLDVTEILSMRKYPAYAEYQRRVPRFVPWWPSGDGANDSRDSSGAPSPRGLL